MRISRRQFLRGDLSGRGALRCDRDAWPVKAEIGAACIAFGQVVCRSCGDACEVRAIRFILRARGVAVPDLDPDACTGCGACHGACPVGAIAMRYVDTEVTA